MGSFAHLVAGAFGDLLALVHDDDAVGELHHHVELVLDQQDGQPLGLQVGDEPLHLGGLGRVHAGGRLVEQQQARLERQRARDLDAAAVGVGQAVGRLVDARQQPLAEARQDLLHLLAQPLLFGLDRWRAATAPAPVPAAARSAAWPGFTARSRVCAPISTLSMHAEIAEHAAVLERARDASGRQLLRREAGDVAAPRSGPRRRRADRAR